MAAFINARWPTDLRPTTCAFGRSRNDIAQESPRTRQRSFIRQGRPLYHADLSWTYGNTSQLAKLRYYLEKLEGFAGSVQLWNFASPYPYGISFGYGSAPYFDRRTLWTHNGNQYPFTWAGRPSHWLSGAVVQLNGAASAGATSIAVDGLAVSSIAVITGQYVQVGRRLYVAATDVLSNGSGQATIELTSGLLAASADNDQVRLVEAGCEMEMLSQEFEESAVAGDGTLTISARFRETVQDVTA